LTDGTLITSSTYLSYQWARNGIDIPGETKFAYKPTTGGNYTVRVSNGGCEDVSPAHMSGGMSVNSIGINGGAYIYPNPATNYIIVTAPAQSSISIMSMDGKMLVQQSLQNQNVDISSLPEGIYMVRIADQDGMTIRTEKLVKRAN
jgi:hypothetical protein